MNNWTHKGRMELLHFVAFCLPTGIFPGEYNRLGKPRGGSKAFEGNRILCLRRLRASFLFDTPPLLTGMTLLGQAKVPRLHSVLRQLPFGGSA